MVDASRAGDPADDATGATAAQRRRRIDIAVGMVMAHRRLSQAEAAKVLTELSRMRCVPLDQLAEELIEHQAELRDRASEDTVAIAGSPLPSPPVSTAATAAPGPRWWR